MEMRYAEGAAKLWDFQGGGRGEKRGGVSVGGR